VKIVMHPELILLQGWEKLVEEDCYDEAKLAAFVKE
jgi:hypothetical protein